MSVSQSTFSQQNKAELPRARSRYIAQSIQLEESDAPGVVSVAIFASVFLVILFVAWTWITPINEVAITQGEIVPQGKNYIVQHLEGGIVAEILVENGEEVNEGDLLLQIVPVATESDYEQLNTRHSTLSMRRIRLHALLENQAPVFEPFNQFFPELAQAEYETYEAQRQSRIAQLNTLDAKIAQREQEYRREQQKLQALEKELAVLRQQVGMRERLVEKGIVARTELLDFQTELAETRTQYDQTRANIDVFRQSINEAKTARSEGEVRIQEQHKLEYSAVSAELEELARQLVKYGDRVDRLKVRAPAHGLVTGLTVNTIQSVIEPGKVLMEIVPVDKELIVESRVTTEDIGHVHVGQKATVKVGSYDPQRFGTITGQVEKISPSTFLDEEQKPYYKAVIELEKQYLGAMPNTFKLLPGMTVQADIRTGEKTVLDYLLKPIYRGFQNAFQER